MKINLIKYFLFLILTLILTGCGAAHVKVVSKAGGLSSYKNIHVANVSISSKQQSGNLLALNKKYEEFAKNEILQTIKKKLDFKLVDDPKKETDKTLIIETEIQIDFGHRGLRWVAGIFGAGKGKVNTILKVKDSGDESIKLEITSVSELSVGFGGGNMRSVIRKNIIKLVRALDKEL